VLRQLRTAAGAALLVLLSDGALAFMSGRYVDICAGAGKPELLGKADHEQEQVTCWQISTLCLEGADQPGML
jgi:hypothetical protein